jgi:hypothetical protein
LAILTDREKKQWARLTALSLVISMADIASLALLLYIIHFYTQPVDAVTSFTPLLGKSMTQWLFDRSSLMLITLFFMVFALKNLAAYLNPGGRVAVIEFIPDQSPHKADPTLVVSEQQTNEWMAAAGLKPVEKVNLFTDKYFVIYGK